MPATTTTGSFPLLPRRRKRRLGRVVMIIFASLWVVGCVVGLCYAFSAVRIHNAGCPDCILYPP